MKRNRKKEKFKKKKREEKCGIKLYDCFEKKTTVFYDLMPQDIIFNLGLI